MTHEEGKIIISRSQPVSFTYYIVISTYGNKIENWAKLDLIICGKETITAKSSSIDLYFDYDPNNTYKVGSSYIDSMFDIGNLAAEAVFCMKDFNNIDRGFRIFTNSALTDLDYD